MKSFWFCLNCLILTLMTAGCKPRNDNSRVASSVNPATGDTGPIYQVYIVDGNQTQILHKYECTNPADVVFLTTKCKELAKVVLSENVKTRLASRLSELNYRFDEILQTLQSEMTPTTFEDAAIYGALDAVFDLPAQVTKKPALVYFGTTQSSGGPSTQADYSNPDIVVKVLEDIYRVEAPYSGRSACYGDAFSLRSEFFRNDFNILLLCSFTTSRACWADSRSILFSKNEASIKVVLDKCVKSEPGRQLLFSALMGKLLSPNVESAVINEFCAGKSVTSIETRCPGFLEFFRRKK